MCTSQIGCVRRMCGLQNAHLREEVQRLLQRIRVMEEEISRHNRYAAEET